MGILMLKIRMLQDRLIFNMGIPKLVRRYLYTETPKKIVFLYKILIVKIWRPSNVYIGNSFTGKMITAWASCQIRKIAGAHAPGMLGTFSPPPRVSNPDMHHGTCVTHVPWCMPGTLSRGFLWISAAGETFPAFPAHAQPSLLRIW